MLQGWQDEGFHCTPSAPGTSWHLGWQSPHPGPSLCQTQGLPGPMSPTAPALAQLGGHSPSCLPTSSMDSLQPANTKTEKRKDKNRISFQPDWGKKFKTQDRCEGLPSCPLEQHPTLPQVPTSNNAKRLNSLWFCY